MNRYSLVAIALLALVTTSQPAYASPIILEKQVAVEKSLWFSKAKELEVKLSNPEIAAAYARSMNAGTDLDIVTKNIMIGLSSALAVAFATVFIGTCYEWIQNQKKNAAWDALIIEEQKNRVAAEKAKRELYIKHAQEETQAYHQQKMTRIQQDTDNIGEYAENNVAYDKGWKEQQIARAAAEVEAIRVTAAQNQNKDNQKVELLSISTTLSANQAAAAA